MNIERKSLPKISRREFLIGVGALIGSAVLAGCKKEEQPTSFPTPKSTETLKPTFAPTEKPTNTPLPTETPTPEFTPTPEPKRIVATIINKEYLKQAFAGVGGEEVIENGQEETTLIAFGQDYVSQAWGEEIDFKTLPEDPIASLKYIVSLGSYQGEEGIFYPGKQGEEEIFPQIGDLSLARLTLENVPSEADQKNQEYKEWTTPLNFLLRPETQMTVVGLLDEVRPIEETVVDKDDSGEQLDYALVAFTDYLRVSEESGVPRHYFAVIPTHFPGDPENKKALTLANLLEANGYEYDEQNKEITVVEKNSQKTILELNQIEGEELTKDLRQAAGLAFVDQMKGELIKNPLVPYPDEMPEAWSIQTKLDEDGTISLLLQGQDEKGEMVDVAKASYDQEKEGWKWEKIEAEPTPTPILSPEEEQQLKEDIIRLFPGEKSKGAQEILGILDESKQYDPKKFPDNSMQYSCYLAILSRLRGEYYASGGSPEKRNPEILKVLAQIREMARENTDFHEEDWEVEGAEVY